MNKNNEEVINIPINKIHVLNPRVRDQQKFELLMDSIKTVGMKKPVTVSERLVADGEEAGYDLVCGQGRMLALQALGYKEVPAIVIKISKSDRLLMSLVENIARHPPELMDLIAEVERLKLLGFNHSEIGRKIGVSGSNVTGFLALKNAGEERILRCVLQGKIPVGVGMEIAQADTTEKQAALLAAYETRMMNKNSIRTARSIMKTRRHLGKQLGTQYGKRKPSQPTAEQLVAATQKEYKWQRLYVCNARACERRLSFIQGAMRELLKDEGFLQILKSEKLDTMPKPLAECVKRTSTESTS